MAPDREDVAYMRLALRQARRAQAHDEVPVGAVIVRHGVILGHGYNRREARCDATAHAEVVALRRAGRRAGTWRLDGATVYVTLEPCAMCTAALGMARVARLVFGAADERVGACGSFMSLADYPGMGWSMQVVGGCLAKHSADLLSRFFAGRRGL